VVVELIYLSVISIRYIITINYIIIIIMDMKVSDYFIFNVMIILYKWKFLKLGKLYVTVCVRFCLFGTIQWF